MSVTSTRDRLLRLLEPVVTAEGLDLEDVSVTSAGKRRLLRVTVDRDGGVSLDDVAVLSQSISGALDASEVMTDPYVLEVTSPGVDRPLTVPRHWRRAMSRLVRAVLADGGEVTGRVRQADEDGATLDVEGDERRLAYAEIRRATVTVEFNRAAADDSGPDGAASSAKEA
jgi:ribosome maturation factor RimP